jgi:hypothetical protein
MRIAVATVLTAGCAVVALDVGSDAPEAVTNVDAGDAGDAATTDAPTALLQRLAERCAAKAGTADYYANGAELTTRLRGRWYACDLEGVWSAPPQAVSFAPGPNGTYAFLALSSAGDDFVPSSAPGDVGGLEYTVPAGAPGDPNETIAFDDTSPRNGFTLQLVRGLPRSNFEFIPDFETNPRRLRLRELGPDPAIGVFVPID